MKKFSGNCVLSFVLLGSDAIEHEITSVEYINHSNLIISGDKNGRIVVWKINDDDEISLLWLLIGHNGKIELLSAIENSNRFVSVSKNKEMALWNAEDGKCLKMEKNIQYEHKFIKSYRIEDPEKSLLLCSGHYPGILVLNEINLSLRIILRSQSHPNWIISSCCFQHKQSLQLHIVLGLNVDNAVNMWTLDTNNDYLSVSSPLKSMSSSSVVHYKPHIILETESKLLQASMSISPLVISICPNKPRLVLIVSKNQAQIYDAASWTVLSQLTFDPQESYLTGGIYVDSSRILLSNELGETSIYNIPRQVQLIQTTSSSDGLSHRMSRGLVLCGPSVDFVCGNLSPGGVVIASSGGDSCGSIIKLVSLERKVAEADLRSSWPGKARFGVVLAAITSCISSGDDNRVYLGTEDGQIYMGKLLDVCVALISGDYHLPSELLTLFIEGRHKGSVLCLYESSSSSMLASGGSDFCIRLWKITDRTGKCIRELNCHSSPIFRFIAQPILPNTPMTASSHSTSHKHHSNKSTNPSGSLKLIGYDNGGDFQNLVISLDQSGGLSVLNLNQMNVVLSTKVSLTFYSYIGWRVDHMALIIANGDGHICIWDLSSSCLDRVEPAGQVASDILDSCVGLTQLTTFSSGLLDAGSLMNLTERLECTHNSALSIHTLDKLLFITLDTECILQMLFYKDTDTTHTLKVIQLLLSLTNRWGEDPILDKTLWSSLGLIKPVISMYSLVKSGAAAPTMGIYLKDTHQSQAQTSSSSSAATTTDSSPFVLLSIETIIAAISCCQVLSSLSDKFMPDGPWPKLHQQINKSNTQGITEARQVACLLATSLATSSLPNSIKSFQYDSFDRLRDCLIPLLSKYQDRCLEIREGARTLLHAVLDSLTPGQRWNLLNWWINRSLPPAIGSILSGGTNLTIFDDCIIHTDLHSDWCCLLILVAVVGVRFNHYGDVNNNNHDDLRMGRAVAHQLMYLMGGAANRTSRNAHVWPMLRRAALSLLGNGFVVWEPHLDAGTLFQRLLEIAAYAERALTGWTPGQLLSDEADAGRTARGALHAVAFLRPKVFATVLSIEVLKLQSASSVQSNSNSSSGVSASSAGGSSGTGLAGSVGNQPVLLAARHEVLQVLQQLCERKTKEAHEVLPEIMDILLACLNKIELRQYDLQQLFPPILLFRPVASHTSSGKVCVGTRTGVVVFYDIKIGKYSAIAGHKGQVTSVTFGPDGRQVASYSMPDNSVCVWQLTSSGLFGMGSSHSAKLVSTLQVPPVSVVETVSQEDSGLLLWLEWTETKALHLVTSAGLINKIKL